MTTLCAHTCVGRIRYVGLFLYDADRIAEVASVGGDTEVYPAHLDLLLDPEDPEVRDRAAADGISPNVIDAAIRSPVFKLAKAWKLALPLHPEFRTLPMVWYIPPLSPIREYADPGQEGDLIDRLRIPVRFLANLLTAGDEAPVRLALHRLSAIRQYMRSVRVEGKGDDAPLQAVGLDRVAAESVYRLLALARFEERYVLPANRPGDATLHELQGRCGFTPDAVYVHSASLRRIEPNADTRAISKVIISASRISRRKTVELSTGGGPGCGVPAGRGSKNQSGSIPAGYGQSFPHPRPGEIHHDI